MRRMLLCSVAWSVACGTVPSDDFTPQTRTSRTIEPVTDHTVLASGGLADTVLLNPALLRATDSFVVVFDRGRHAVESFDHDGKPAWITGRAGGGPGEFRQVTDMQVEPDGYVWVLDLANTRLTRISPTGIIVHSMPLPHDVRDADRLLLLNADTLALLRTSEPAFVLVDSTGAVLARHNHPWRGYRDYEPLAVYARALAIWDEPRIVLFLAYGGGLVLTDHRLTEASAVSYVVPVPIPGVIRKQENGQRITSIDTRTLAARDAALAGGRVYVLSGSDADAGSIVDMYDAQSGAYLATRHLPLRIRSIAVARDTLFALDFENIPRLVAFPLEASGPQ